MKRIAVIVFFITIVSVLSENVYSMGRRSGQEDERETVEAEKLAYNFHLQELDGDKYYALSDFIGKPIFLAFWASWCPPCRNSVPAIEELYEKFKGNVYVVGINLDRDLKAAIKLLSENDIQFMQLRGAKSEVPVRYGVRGIPAFFIIDSAGKIVKRYAGYTDVYYSEWVEILTQLIQEKIKY